MRGRELVDSDRFRSSGRFKVNYTESIKEMTQSLYIFDQLIEVKKQEKEELTQ